MRAWARLSWMATAVAVAVAGGLLAGFISFAEEVAQEARVSPSHSDGIVVLTGGEYRIEAAVRLLEAGYAERMLVSGINKRTSPEDVRHLLKLDPAQFARSRQLGAVELGYEARNTFENAEETRAWALRHHIRRLIVVTAVNHMPRSLAEIGHALPGVELVPHSVLPPGYREPWWTSQASVRMLLAEYLKYLPSQGLLMLRTVFGQAREGLVAAEAATAPRSPTDTTPPALLVPADPRPSPVPGGATPSPANHRAI